jgi:hypothetical protein
MIVFRKFEKLFDILGEIAAFLTIALIAALFLNARYNFIPADTVSVLETIREYAILGTLVIVGLEFACKKGIIVFALYAALAVVAIIYSFPALF